MFAKFSSLLGMSHSKGRRRGGLFFAFGCWLRETQARVYPRTRDVLRADGWPCHGRRRSNDLPRPCSAMARKSCRGAWIARSAMCVIKASIYGNLQKRSYISRSYRGSPSPYKLQARRVVEAGVTPWAAQLCAGGASMPAAETNNYVFQRQKRAVAIRRDGDDFVVSLMPNDLVIFRNESADALRKVCKGLRWAVVSDTAIASI